MTSEQIEDAHLALFKLLRAKHYLCQAIDALAKTDLAIYYDVDNLYNTIKHCSDVLEADIKGKEETE